RRRAERLAGATGQPRPADHYPRRGDVTVDRCGAAGGALGQRPGASEPAVLLDGRSAAHRRALRVGDNATRRPQLIPSPRRGVAASEVVRHTSYRDRFGSPLRGEEPRTGLAGTSPDSTVVGSLYDSPPRVG